MPDESETYPPCRCGREVRKLNAASDTPKCVGCGYTEELCRCFPEGALVANVTGVGCPPDCDHAHAAEPKGSFLDRFTWDGEQWQRI